ncbi:MAG: hypothetical protein LPK14_13300 [Hymenobacteraceae bacterium]|nr:hypothetical protein [Hymenobacteraceae bacterium]
MTAIEKLELPFLHITYRQDLGVLFCRWRAAVDLPRFMEGYTTALHFASGHKAHFWLHDLRLRNASDALLRGWYDHDFVPAVKTSLGAITYVAYLMLPFQRQYLASEDMPVSEVISYGDTLHLRYFINEHDALQWLQECQHAAALAH